MMEDVKQELFCKLCLGTEFGVDSQVIDSTEVALNGLNLNLNITKNDIICSECSESLSAAFNFKLMCLETEDNITPYVHSADNLVDIKEIYKNVKDDKKLMNMEDPKICRLCLNLVTCEFKSVNELDLDTIRAYIPEINFFSVDDPILCQICYDSLCHHSAFLKNCLGEKKDINLVHNQCFIKTEECEIKSEEDEQREPDVSLLIPKGKKRKLNKNTQIRGKKSKNKKSPSKRENKYTFYYCDKCNYKTNCTNDLTQHRDIHNTVKTYTCEKCGFKTTWKKRLMDHSKLHDKEKPNVEKYSPHNESAEILECDVCGWITKYEQFLINHMKIHKSVEAQIYKCDKCPFQTLDEQCMTEHDVLHIKPEEEKLYNCEICDFSTEKKACLSIHELTHTSQSETETFQCAKCDFNTVWKSSMKVHALKHTDSFAKCKFCSYETRFKSNLYRHNKMAHKSITRPEESS